MANQQIVEFAAKQNAFMDRLEVAHTGIASDIVSLNETITKLQNTPPVLTAEDQALLDTIQSKSEALAAKIEALDNLTPPPVPPVV